MEDATASTGVTGESGKESLREKKNKIKMKNKLLQLNLRGNLD